MRLNPILRTDSYKASHFLQLPPGTTHLSSYVEPRAGAAFDEIVFFGLQAFIKDHLLNPITMDDVDEAEEVFRLHGEPFNRADWVRIVTEHGGYIPIAIEAIPEGTVHGPGVPEVQVINTDSRMPWVTSYIETSLLRSIWYPTAVATMSREVKKIIRAGMEASCDTLDGLPFKLHDFGGRGATSAESAGLGGCGHLVNFMGTDTVEALMVARHFYNEPMAGFSIPASEHSTMTAWGRPMEAAAYENMLDQFPTGLVSVVSDSYDLMHAVTSIWGQQLRDKVLARDGTLVVRPDSGDPTTVPVEVIEALMVAFGSTVNSKGYRVLPKQVRVIQGDGMNRASLDTLIQNLIAARISVENIAFGMGGGLLQGVTRDTLRFAMKANSVRIDGVWHDVFKQPATDMTKQSKRGRQAVISKDGGLKAVPYDLLPDVRTNKLRPVYKDGVLLIDDTLSAIRDRAAL